MPVVVGDLLSGRPVPCGGVFGVGVHCLGPRDVLFSEIVLSCRGLSALLGGQGLGPGKSGLLVGIGLRLLLACPSSLPISGGSLLLSANAVRLRGLTQRARLLSTTLDLPPLTST